MPYRHDALWTPTMVTKDRHWGGVMQDLVLKRIFILAAIVAVGWVIYLLMPVLIPFIAAFLLAYLLSAPVDWLQRMGLPRWLGISLLFLVTLLGLGLAVWFLVPLIWKQLIYARDHIPEFFKYINNTFLPWLTHKFNLPKMQIRADEISTSISNYLQTSYNMGSVQDAVATLAKSGMNVVAIGGTAILVPIIAFYFLLDWNNMLQRLQRMIPRPMETGAVQIARECHDVLGAFVRGQLLVMVLLGIVYAVGLQLIGIQVGVVIGLMAGLASIIPYLGFITGIIAAVIACLLQYGFDMTHLALVGVVFFIGQMVEGYILQPFLLGDKIGLSPVAVVFAVLAGAHLMGFAGMLIALPAAAVLVVLLRHVYDAYEHSRMYGGHAFNLPENVVLLKDEAAAQEPIIIPVEPKVDLRSGD